MSRRNAEPRLQVLPAVAGTPLISIKDDGVLERLLEIGGQFTNPPASIHVGLARKQVEVVFVSLAGRLEGKLQKQSGCEQNSRERIFGHEVGRVGDPFVEYILLTPASVKSIYLTRFRISSWYHTTLQASGGDGFQGLSGACAIPAFSEKGSRRLCSQFLK